MTATTDPVRALIDALPRHVRARLHVTQTLQGAIHAAIRDHGWTIPQLAQECRRDLDGVVNASARVEQRLRWAAGHDAPSKRAKPRPLCGQCEHGWVYDDTNGTATRCACRDKEEAID